MTPLERRLVAALVVALLGTAIGFRLLHLSSVPGINGDEGWWGIQATAWLAGRPYVTHTTSGNPTDLLLLIPLALIHSVAAPSVVALRAFPTFVNLLALPVGFWFVRRIYDSATAWIYTVALAILPTAIAHSRICQDPSQTVFWTGLVVYVSLLGFKEHERALRYAAAALVLFPIVLWTHPTNVFVGPFLLLPWATAIGPRLPASRSRRTILFAAAAVVIAVAAFAGWAAIKYVAPSNSYLDRPWLSIATRRLTDGAQWFEFAANNARLFNGVTIYHYFSGARPATVPFDAVFVVVVSTLLAGLLLARTSAHRRLDVGLMLACAGTWLFFFELAGPEALRPHFERWGLCLLVPGTLVLARGLAAWLEWMPKVRWFAIGASSVVAAGLLASFYVNYFREFATTGGRSHLTYVTAPTEPKQQAFEYIVARTDGPGAVEIVAQQWWIAKPITYLATNRSNVSVSMLLSAEREPGFQEALRNGRLFFVEFAGTPELKTAIDWIGDRGLRATRTTVHDAGGRDLLEILQVTATR